MDKLNDIPKTSIPEKSESASVNARGVIYELFGASFVEIGSFVGRVEHNNVVPCDVVTGYGSCNGRLVFIFAQDEENGGGAITEASANKIVRIVEMAVKSGAPLLGIFSSRGGKVSDGLGVLVGYGKIMKAIREAQGIIPTVALITGYCTGGMAAIASLFNIAIGVEGGKLYVSPPDTVYSNTEYKSTSLGNCLHVDIELGTVKAAAKLGGISVYCEDVSSACDKFRELLSYIPSVCGEFVIDSEDSDDENRMTDEISDVIDSNACSASEIIKIISDNSKYFEISSVYASEILTVFAKLGGIAVGIVANDPSFGNGVITSASAEKAANFITLCDLFGLPIITLVDAVGFDSSLSSELAPMSEKIANLAAAYIDAEVPKLTVITRKAYGTAYTVMGSTALGADICLALKGSEIGTLSPETAAQFLYSDKINSSDDPAKTRREAESAWRAANTDIGVAAASGSIDDIILPAELRKRIIAGLYMLTFDN